MILYECIYFLIFILFQLFCSKIKLKRIIIVVYYNKYSVLGWLFILKTFQRLIQR